MLLWAGDVGQDVWEEITVVRKGEHHGWNTREAFECYRSATCREEGLTPPVMSYGHGLGKSVTGGFVYRGQRLPELRGAYLFADFESGRVWALRAQGRVASQVVEVADTNLQISSFGVQPDGDLVLVSFNGSSNLWRLARAAAVEAPEPFPERLSDTGCFADARTLSPAPGVAPYDLNVPFWSDGAAKRRWLALPDGETLRPGARPEDAWWAPVGTVLIKHFDAVVGEASRKLETRLLVRRADRWQGYLYQWDDAGREATLRQGRHERTFEVGGDAWRWEFPSKNDCDTCHAEAAGVF